MPILSSPFRLALLPFSLLLAYGSSTHAQQATKEDAVEALPKQTKQTKPANLAKPAADKLQKVEISGAKGYDERRQDTASKIVVTQEEIVRYGDTNIGDVLKRLPGVTIGGVQGRGGSIRMRGLGAGYTQIMLNGEPSPPGFSLDSISPDNIERIEVIRSATAELSTQSIAGAINIVLKKAIVTAQRELKVGMQEEGGKYGANVSLQFSDKLGRMSYSISGNLNSGKYERPSSSDEIGKGANGTPTLDRHTDSKDWGTFTGLGFSPRVNWNLENGDTVTSQSFVHANRFSGFNQQVSSGDLPLYASDLTQIESEFAMIRSNLNWIRKLADSAKLDVKLGVSYNKRSSDVGYQGYNAKHLQTLDRKASSGASDQGFTWGGKYTAPFVTDHSIAAGWDGALSKRNENRTQHDQVFKPEVNDPVINPINLDETFDAEVVRLALFVQDEWNVSKNWSIYAGLRWEGLDTSSKGNSYAEVNNKSSVWSPILQTLWKLPDSKNDQVRLGLTRTYKAPDTGSLIPRRFISNDNKATSPDRMGNPNLKPELAWGLDAAFEHYLTDGGMLSASVFMRRIEDITRTDISDATGVWIAMPINDGIATTRGIELEAKFPLRSIMSDAPAIDFRSNLSFNWSNLSSVPGPNNRLDSQTPISANVGIDYKLDQLPLTLGGNYSFQNGGPVRISVEQSAYSIPKRVLDLYALWKFDPKTNLRVSLGNVLHQDNISATTYVDAKGSLMRTTTTPTTVAVRAMLEHKF
ncbi:MAG: TonB-dependent receptor [Undibacterium sp.]|nr:TonB-dependent receptor [Undibacterium sp.]